MSGNLTSDRNRHGGAVGEAGFFEDAMHMIFGGEQRDAQSGGNLFIAKAFGDQARNLDLTRREVQFRFRFCRNAMQNHHREPQVLSGAVINGDLAKLGGLGSEGGKLIQRQSRAGVRLGVENQFAKPSEPRGIERPRSLRHISGL